jgi:sortase A
VTLGLLILLFVAYQLWGTGIFTARAQESLKSDFKKAQEQYREDNPLVETPTSVPKGGPSTTVSPLRKGAPPPTPPEGEVEGMINIPRIGLNMAFVEGTNRDDLKKGPGHYDYTVPPGTLGNAAIAGHRTTYLHPFYDIDKLQPGDPIYIGTLDGKKFTYKMEWQRIVRPDETWVADKTPDAVLTLTSCNPKYSAAQRIVIRAKLVPTESDAVTKAPALPASAGKSKGDLQGESLSSESQSVPPAILWGIIAAVVGALWWWGFRRWRHPAMWVAGLIPFLAVLFGFYVYLERAIPQGLYSG